MKTPLRERPIIFSGEMVRAILEGRKTQTRRVVNPAPTTFRNGWPLKRIVSRIAVGTRSDHTLVEDRSCPYGQPNDRLWVRETWAGCCGRYGYKADGAVRGRFKKSWIRDCRWKPSIHMPRSAARIFLKVQNVRVQRLQDIIEQDAAAEGVQVPVRQDRKGWYQEISGPYVPKAPTCREHFILLWERLNAKRGHGWKTNCWIWVIEFKRID